MKVNATDYLDACLAGVADHIGLSAAELRSGADARAREGRACAAWFARGQVDVHQEGWQVIAAAYGFETPGDAVAAVDRVDKGGSKLLDTCGMALAIMARFNGRALTLSAVPLRPGKSHRGDSEPQEPPPGWDPEEDECEDADPLDPDWQPAI